MARVFDAFDERLERRAAVKILRAETRALPGMRQRFQQEALIAARLVHPHIVAVLDFGEDHASSYLVMERLPGTTLRDEIIARGPLSTQRVMLVMGETLDALAAAHARRVLHRDIKPSNILLQQNGHTKITDFGIAKSFDIRTDPAPLTDDMTMTGVVLGTPGYLAPERRSGHPATVQSDLYAVGAVMVEALTGQRLGSGPAPMEKLTPPLREVARRAMAPDPRDRFTSASEMAQSLRTTAGDTGPAPGSRLHTARPARPSRSPSPLGVPVRRARPSSPHAPSRPPDRRGRARRRRFIGATVVVLAVALALFVTLWSGTEPTGPATSAGKARAHPGADASGSEADRHRRLGHQDARHVAGQRRTARRRCAGERSPGDGRATARGGSAGVGAAGALSRRSAARRGRHHLGAVSGRRQRPAADGGHHIHHDNDSHSADAAVPDAVLPGSRPRS